MKLLELFSGTGSVGSAFAARGWEVVSLDLDPKTKAQIHENILTWNYKVSPGDTSMQFGRALVARITPAPAVALKHLEI